MPGRRLLETGAGRRPVADGADDRRVRAAAGVVGISATSAPRAEGGDGRGHRGTAFSTPSIPSESVTTRPWKPRSRRSRPVITFRDTEAGGRGRSRARRCGRSSRPGASSTTAAEGPQVDRVELLAGAPLHRQREVAVGGQRAVPGEVLEHRDHAGVLEALAAATTCRATSAGRSRHCATPMAGSAGPG